MDSSKENGEPARGRGLFRGRSKGTYRLREMVSRLLRLATPHWGVLSVGTFFLLIGSGAGLAYPQIIRMIIDEVLGSRDRELIDQAALSIFALFALQGVALALRSYLFTVTGHRVVADLRKELFRRIMAQEVGFFDSRRTGELTNRLAADTGVIQNTVTVNISMTLRNLLSALGGVSLLAYTSVYLTGWMLVVVPPVAIGTVVAGRLVRRLSRDSQDALARSGEVAEESISGIRTVRTFGNESDAEKFYGRAIEESFGYARTRAKAIAIFIGSSTFAGYAVVALVLWLGGYQVLEGQLSVGELTSFVLYTLIVSFSLGALGGLFADFMRAAGAAERVFELLDRDSLIPNEGGRILEKLSGRVAFERVSFAYPSRGDVDVLKDFDLTMQKGEMVALVGPSGAGKSTVAALLSRLYDPQEGHILVDEQNLRDLDPTWLRRNIAVVSQEPLLFSLSIRENIRYGAPDASDEMVVAAAKTANAHVFVEAFPDGYETLVGERGIQLSGGQKQRVAIARALLRDPAILLLDEATSALDTESESLVQEALERLMEGRTTLVIAHRLSTVHRADRVLVLEDGKIVESGTHATLLAHDGVYNRLVKKQMFSASEQPPSAE